MVQKILIIDDDVAFGTMLQSWFRRNGFEPVLCTKVESTKVELIKEKFDLVLTDLRLPDGDGIEILQWIRDRKMAVPVIVMSGYGEIQSAVSAMKLGAEDFLEKPINPSMLKEKIELALSKKEKVAVSVTKEKKAVKNGMLVGNSDVAKLMYSHILKVAPTRMTVLIRGESGTGKEYAASMIHSNSSRCNEAFIAVDCGSLSSELAPSELFGHLKGSFTSAGNDKIGVFQQASGGTVFLDEVGNLPYDVQVQLLRALQEQKIRPVGSAKDIKVDVRIIVATNEDLEVAISEGRFREDLYHRLNEFSLFVPPLREREGDIELFAMEFLRQANEELDRDIQGFSDVAIQNMKSNYWSGNLRELRNVVRRAALFAIGDIIMAEDLPAFSTPKIDNLALRPDNEKQQIEAALIKAHGNKTLVAQLLRIDRKTLYNKMHQYGIKL